jgi:hypothetical protein
MRVGLRGSMGMMEVKESLQQTDTMMAATVMRRRRLCPRAVKVQTERENP